MRFKKLALIVVTGLVAMVTMVTSVSAASLSELKDQESSTQKDISETNSKIQVTLTSVNAQYQKVDQLKTKIADNEASITNAKKVLKKQAVLLAKRETYAKERLQSLQQSADDRNVVNALLSADSLSDFFNRAYALTVLQSADNQNMDELVQSYHDTKVVQERLETSKTNLDQEKIELDQQTTTLQTQIDQMKTNLSQSRDKLAKIAQEKSTEEAKIAAEQAAAAKAAEQAKAATTVAKVTDTSSSDTAAKQQASLADKASGKAGQTIQVQATAYSIATPGMGRYGATGIDLMKNPNCIAVDPSVIPLGSLVMVPGYGYAIAGDTGGAIKGHIIDVHFPTVGQCVSWGRRSVAITIVQ